MFIAGFTSLCLETIKYNVLNILTIISNLNLSSFISLTFPALFSSGAAFPDPAGRYRRGGGLNVPVEIRLKLRSIESAKIQEKLSSNEIL